MDPDGNTGDNYLALRLNPCHLQKNKNENKVIFSRSIVFLEICDTSPSPALRAAAEQNLREQLGRLMETATQLIQFLLHGEDPLLQLPIGVVPVGAEVAHDHLHLLKSVTRSSANCSY